MIAGLITWGGPPDLRPSLDRMRATPDPLAPERWQCAHQAGCSLAASAADPALAGLARDPSGMRWIVLHGLLYNREELLADLGKSTWVGPQSGDAELVLAAFHRWGLDLLDRLVGDFAFAVYEAEARTLFAAVDPFGMRPFYYAADDGRLAFASRCSLLQALPWVGDDVNERMVVSFLTDAWDDAEATFYRRIRLVPAGHFLRVDARQRTLRRYWIPGRKPCALTRPADVLERFEELFCQAVRQRLPREPMTILMSGGLDSTSVAGVVADLSRREPGAVPPTLVLSGLFGDLACDESTYIRAALRGLPFESRQVCELDRGLTVEQMLEDARRDEAPVPNEQRLLSEAYSSLARTFGARVLMDGLGGDDLVTDYGYSVDLLRSGRLVQFLRAARQNGQIEAYPVGRSLLQVFREACPDAVKRPYRWVRRWFGANGRSSTPTWLAPAVQRAAEEMLCPPAPAPQGFGSRTLEIAWLMLTFPQAQWALRWWVGEFAAAGIRSCSPFLDRRLFDFVYSVPFRLRPRQTETSRFKFFLTQGLRRYLPEELQSRPDKVYFEPYNNHVFALSAGPLQEYLFQHHEWHAEPFVPRAQAEALYAAYRQKQEELRHDSIALAREAVGPLWRIAGLELWLRERYMRRGAPTPFDEVNHGQDR